jgi:hypothetical protein
MTSASIVKTLVVVSLGALLALVACSSNSGGASCGSIGGVCPKDPPASQSEISQCQHLASDAKCGVKFQAYLSCAVGQEKCGANGMTDGNATQTAILTNCANQAQAYMSCVGVSTNGLDGGTSCGYPGGACCTGGQTPCNGGCCDPATQQCVFNNDTCSGTPTTVCTNGTCAACGGPGQGCCPGGTQCSSGGCCDFSGGNQTCIAKGSMCMPLGQNTQVCGSNGFCTGCGTSFSPCCPGNTCTGTNVQCDTTTGNCVSCGSFGEPCCAGNTCPGSTTYACKAGMCVSCGFSGEPCCTGATPCSNGTCTNGMCP